MNDPINEIYSERTAEVYDEWFSTFDEAAIERLAELSQGGRVLELGIGTGLVALPLAARGLEVHGIDGSQAMVHRLRAKPGGEQLPVIMGNFADVDVPGTFSLIYIVYNTFFALPSQDEQVRCVRNVSKHLDDGGLFVVETVVPNLTLFKHDQEIKALTLTSDRVGLKVSQHNPVEQRIKSQHVVMLNGEIKLFPVDIRYAYPAEIDLMAQLAGLRLRHRWGGWNKENFNSTSPKHISVYERPA
jgi:SAM-dependent methyltransferase